MERSKEESVDAAATFPLLDSSERRIALSPTDNEAATMLDMHGTASAQDAQPFTSVRFNRTLLCLLAMLALLCGLIAYQQWNAEFHLLRSSTWMFVHSSSASSLSITRRGDPPSMYAHEQYLANYAEYEVARSNLSREADYLNPNHTCIVRSDQPHTACLLPPVDVSVVSDIHLVLTSCGDQQREMTATCLKSWLLHTPSTVQLHVYLLSDDINVQQPFLDKVIARWPLQRPLNVTYIDLMTALPASHRAYVNEFKRCAPARLFAPYLLPHVDAIVYVDADSVLVSDPRNIWAEFQRYGPTHWLGLAWENNCGRNDLNWYIRRKVNNFPWYKPYGLNSGVMLMNLTRVRGWQANYTDVVIDTFRKYKKKFSLGDQDLLNALVEERRTMQGEEICLPLSTRHNWRTADGCNMMIHPTDPEPITIVHANNRRFFKGSPFDQQLYNYYHEYHQWPSKP